MNSHIELNSLLLELQIVLRIGLRSHWEEQVWHFEESKSKREIQDISVCTAFSVLFSPLKKWHTYSLKLGHTGQMCFLTFLLLTWGSFSHLSVAERTMTLPHNDRQQPLSPINRIAAHLTGNSNRKSSLSPRIDSLARKGNGQKISNWESSRKGHSFLYNVELRNGELVIPQTGFYYIYSQIYFRFRENENEDSDFLAQIRNPKQLVQYVYKLTNYPEPIMLMKSARTSCWSKKAEYGLYSIYQGGVFQLKKEDRIFVSVSNGDIVDMDKEASFFGAFLIG